jgi:predicted DNA-binding transcriptional regulator YafY
LRNDYRHFRVERIVTSTLLDERFPTEGGKLMAGWWAQIGMEETTRRAE